MCFQIVWSQIQLYANNHCQNPCEYIQYDIKIPKLGKNSMTTSFPNQTMFFARYSSPKVKTEEEYTIMGTNAIISATGGSLGLFLGFSCFGAIWSIFEVLKKAYNSTFTSNRKENANSNIC